MHPSSQHGYTPPQASQYTAHGYDGATAQTGAAQAPHYAQSAAAAYGPGAVEYGYGAGIPVAPAPASGIGSWFDFSSSGYLKGFLIGAGATLLLTNSTIQKALIRGTVKAWSFVQGGMEEVKEQFQDVKAEMSQEE